MLSTLKTELVMVHAGKKEECSLFYLTEVLQAHLKLQVSIGKMPQ